VWRSGYAVRGYVAGRDRRVWEGLGSTGRPGLETRQDPRSVALSLMFRCMLTQGCATFVLLPCAASSPDRLGTADLRNGGTTAPKRQSYILLFCTQDAITGYICDMRAKVTLTSGSN